LKKLLFIPRIIQNAPINSVGKGQHSFMLKELVYVLTTGIQEDKLVKVGLICVDSAVGDCLNTQAPFLCSTDLPVYIIT
jgi:hypothetical protein